jgi:hypothetical protein
MANSKPSAQAFGKTFSATSRKQQAGIRDYLLLLFLPTLILHSSDHLNASWQIMSIITVIPRKASSDGPRRKIVIRSASGQQLQERVGQEDPEDGVGQLTIQG